MPMISILRIIPKDEAVFLDIAPENFDSFPLKFKRKDTTFVKKEEFHITLIGGEKEVSGKVSQTLGSQSVINIENQVGKIFENETVYSKEFSFSLIEDVRIIERGNRKAIIQMVIVPKAQEILDEIRRSIFAQLGVSIQLQVPPLHITLYTLESVLKGIGVYSSEQLLQYTKEKIQLPFL